jgi:hypothetical protein
MMIEAHTRSSMPMTRRDFNKQLAVLPALAVAGGAAAPSRPAEVLPFSPLPLSLRVEHVPTPGGCSTIIARRFAEPRACRLCPRAACNHDGGFCMVRVERYVPPAECGLYRLEGGVS